MLRLDKNMGADSSVICGLTTESMEDRKSILARLIHFRSALVVIPYPIPSGQVRTESVASGLHLLSCDHTRQRERTKNCPVGVATE